MTSLAISDDHRSLGDVVSQVLSDNDAWGSALMALEGSQQQPAFWTQAVDLGWPGLHIAEDTGGQGFGLPELAVVVERLGAQAAPGNFLPTTIVSATLQAATQELDSDVGAKAILADLASGRMTAALSLGAIAGGISQNGETVNGTALALCGDRSDLIALTAGADLILVRTDSAGVSVEQSDKLDPSRPMATVKLNSVPIETLVTGGAGMARRFAWVLAAAEAVGGMAACTTATVDYARNRFQFGREIGSFMAVKHHLVNMLSDSELAAAATWDAMRGAQTTDEAEYVAAIAATQSIDSYRRVAALSVQIHGGIGYTWESHTNLHMRRAAGLATFLASTQHPADVVVAHARMGVNRSASINLPPEAAGFRADARIFRASVEAAPEDERQQLWARSGYLVAHWPKPYGRAAGPIEQLVVDEELEGLPRPSLGLGEWLIPSLLEFGTPDQVNRWMWPSLEGDLKWCQLFSEPDAGSDAAAVSSKGVKVDGGWLVTGQKVWTSDARACQYGLATIRTDLEAPKHKGISMMLIDMRVPEVEIRPLTELTGEQLFNEVFFNEVFVPDEAVIGPVNDGWRVARAALGNERVSIGHKPASMVATALVDRLDHCPSDAVASRAVGKLLAEGHAVRMLNVRSAARLVDGGSMGVEGSLAKLLGAEHGQRVVDLGLELLGPLASTATDPELIHDYFFTRCLTIAGGTSEVLRNQIGERVLQLPREPLPATRQ